MGVRVRAQNGGKSQFVGKAMRLTAHDGIIREAKEVKGPMFS